MSKSTTKFDPEEVEVLLSEADVVPHKSDVVFKDQTINTDTSTKYGPKTVYGIIMICLGTMMYGLTGTLVRLSMVGQAQAPYNSNAALVLSECGKFIVTCLLLIYTQGIKGSIRSIQSVPSREWFLFSVPAIIYSITNNLEFYILKYMDPGSLVVLQQTKIITTAILWWYWFKKGIDKQQWVSLVLLCIGSMLVAWPDDTKNNTQEMYVEWPMGPAFLGAQVVLSAVAGVYTEGVYKKFGSNRSMHVDNLSMYFWGFLSNFAQYYYANDDGRGLLDGFNMYGYLVVINLMVLGLTIAYVMKYFTNIIKLFMSGLAIIVSGILTFVMFGLSWTVMYCIGLVVVVAAVVLYKSPIKYIR